MDHGACQGLVCVCVGEGLLRGQHCGITILKVGGKGLWGTQWRNVLTGRGQHVSQLALHVNLCGRQGTTK